MCVFNSFHSALDATPMSFCSFAIRQRKIWSGPSRQSCGEWPADHCKRRGLKAITSKRWRLAVRVVIALSSSPLAFRSPLPLQRCWERGKVQQKNMKAQIQTVHSRTERSFNIFEISPVIKLFLLRHAHACRDQHAGTTPAVGTLCAHSLAGHLSIARSRIWHIPDPKRGQALDRSSATRSIALWWAWQEEPIEPTGVKFVSTVTCLSC